MLTAGGYVVLVVGVGALVGARTPGYWPSLLATVAVALAFQPLRRRVLGFADRLAYGVRAAPYEALADFTRRLSGSLTTSEMLAVVAAAAADAVGAQAASARLDGADGGLVARWGAAPELPVTAELAVVDRGEPLGAVTVAMPPGRTLRPGDRRLLDDLAHQAGLAFRNAALAAELVGRVRLLDERTAELARSRARIIAARDEERARLARAIAREVSSGLEDVPDALERLATRSARAMPGRSSTSSWPGRSRPSSGCAT